MLYGCTKGCAIVGSLDGTSIFIDLWLEDSRVWFTAVILAVMSASIARSLALAIGSIEVMGD